MQAREELLAIAQIVVALISFSSLISVFGSRGSAGLQPRDFAGLAMVLGAGALALIFSLLPLPLAHLGLSEPAVWAASPAVFSLACFVALGAFLTVNWQLNRAGHTERSRFSNRVSQVLTGLIALLLTLSALDVVLPRGPGIYVLALVACLVLCLYFVVLLLVLVQRRPG
jgi:hydrogenase-4 membrane subunit HyfE